MTRGLPQPARGTSLWEASGFAMTMIRSRYNMNILLFTTGGTIGSAFDGNSINVSHKGCSVVEKYLSENTHACVQFDIKSPLNILSESITADDFNTLAKALFEADLSDYDGVILTVGSDNLAYLGTFVGLLFGGCGVPICLVASDKVLSDPGANGTVNFACAVELIRQKKSGVYVPYRNSDGVMYVHSATDIRQADLSDDFVSFHGAYAVFETGTLREKRPYIAQHIPPVFDRDMPPQIDDIVLLIHPYPLQDYSGIQPVITRAALHTLYHSATSDSERFIPWMKAHPDFPVFLASFLSGRKLYRTAIDAIEAGAIPLYDIAPECAYVKLLLACAQGVMSIKEFMKKW